MGIKGKMIRRRAGQRCETLNSGDLSSRNPQMSFLGGN